MGATLEIPALADNFSRVIDFIGEQLENAGCGMKLQMQIETVVEEIFVNIASYAYKDKIGDAAIMFCCENDIVRITFKDNGIPFDPLAHDDPDINLPSEERQIGGLGILMVKKMMDEVTYSRENDCNILTIEKSIK